MVKRPILLAATGAVLVASAWYLSQRPAKSTGLPKEVQSLPLEEEKIMKLIHRQEMIRITQKPYFVYRPSKSSMGLCILPAGIPHTPHGNHWIHVFATPGATNAMLTGKGQYPEGSIILKEKFRDPAGERRELTTGMRKRERGYNPELGDWEFFILSGGQVSARGKIESCMDCHAKYKATDFVSRKYLTTDEDDGEDERK
jgi:hypothetical protein